jgi:hypothetical protein
MHLRLEKFIFVITGNNLGCIISLVILQSSVWRSYKPERRLRPSCSFDLFKVLNLRLRQWLDRIKFLLEVIREVGGSWTPLMPFQYMDICANLNPKMFYIFFQGHLDRIHRRWIGPVFDRVSATSVEPSTISLQSSFCGIEAVLVHSPRGPCESFAMKE